VTATRVFTRGENARMCILILLVLLPYISIRWRSTVGSSVEV